MHLEPLTVEDENILKLMGGNIVVCGDDDILEAGLPIMDKVSSISTIYTRLLEYCYIHIYYILSSLYFYIYCLTLQIYIIQYVLFPVAKQGGVWDCN